MKAIEEDAKKRAAENRKGKVKAEELKEMGNKCYKKQKYQDAIKFYSEALNEIRTNTAIYTNRAQVIKC
jgi:tetratricopeptide (TPR) repeat protein